MENQHTMNILLITPAPPSSQAGNRATAMRWAGFLTQLGHQVQVEINYQDTNADLLIALHAWRSAEAIETFKQSYPNRPIILVLTGTDIYKFQMSHPEIVYAAMDKADALIGLHDRVHKDIPIRYQQKLHCILQSCIFQSGVCQSSEPPPINTSATDVTSEFFDVCVIGHLREEKDSLRAALAVRGLPLNSKIRVIQVGKAHDLSWEKQALEEAKHNPRYQWLGEIPHADIIKLMKSSRLMVISSIMEGGANVISEACIAGLPIIASDISGNIGVLGELYEGYFTTGDTHSLQQQLVKAEQQPRWLVTLRQHCFQLSEHFRPDCERASLKSLIEQLVKQE